MRPPQRCFSGDWKARRHGTLPIGIDYLGKWPTTLAALCWRMLLDLVLDGTINPIRRNSARSARGVASRTPPLARLRASRPSGKQFAAVFSACHAPAGSTISDARRNTSVRVRDVMGVAAGATLQKIVLFLRLVGLAVRQGRVHKTAAAEAAVCDRPPPSMARTSRARTRLLRSLTGANRVERFGVVFAPRQIEQLDQLITVHCHRAPAYSSTLRLIEHSTGENAFQRDDITPEASRHVTRSRS